MFVLRSPPVPPALAVAVFAAALALPWGAAAHGFTHVVREGGAVAVQVQGADGRAPGQATWQAFSPADPQAPFARGALDPRGWLAFVPDRPGTWRVQVVDPSGHGLTLEVSVDEAGAVHTGDEGHAHTGDEGHSHIHDHDGAPWGRWARVLAGVGLIAALFAGLTVRLRRRSGSGGPR